MHQSDSSSIAFLIPPLGAPPAQRVAHALRARATRPCLPLAHAAPGPRCSPTGLPSPPGAQPSPQVASSPQPAPREVVHSAGGFSGDESQVEPPSPDDEPSDPEEPPNTPLADEKRAVVVYAARNLLNTVDTRPLGTAWFSA